MKLLANDYNALDYAISAIDLKIEDAINENNIDLVEELKQYRNSLFNIFANNR